MLGIIIVIVLLFYLGRAFYDLAADYDKSKWGFAILGIATYYAGTFIAGIFLAILSLIKGVDYTSTLPKWAVALIAIPFGLLSCFVLYRILLHVWDKQEVHKETESIDGNLS